MSTIIQWRCFAPTEDDDKRLKYARYVLISAVLVLFVGLVLCVALPSLWGLSLVLLALLVMFAVAMLNCYVTLQRRQERLRRSEAAAMHNLYAESATPTNTGTGRATGTGNSAGDDTLQVDLPTYHEARFQTYPAVPPPDAPPVRPDAAGKPEPPPPSYEDAVSS
ncbi:PREDICTED: uncharacterized protein LOC109486558 [Branchiostoma belcheri]|uniref:Uncharacterized protein LOC109486558 n=1 Tax=Branchiostoma belcheri TaxID=7741 RepID=A0A6P5AI55_BRABE|nr:PREDICTED: uncharacterized protein LOC109486558 [Branchiostoma belcheri]